MDIDYPINWTRSLIHPILKMVGYVDWIAAFLLSAAELSLAREILYIPITLALFRVCVSHILVYLLPRKERRASAA